MFKKFVGVLFTFAVLALLVFVLLGIGSYSSLLPEDLFSAEQAASIGQVESVVE